MNATMSTFYYPNEIDQDYLNAMEEAGEKPNLINGRDPDPV